MKITCCRGCEERFVGCHSVCVDYQNQKKNLEETEKLRKRKEFERGLYNSKRREIKDKIR